MAQPSARLFVCVSARAAVIRIQGRANFSSSVNFKTLISELHQRGAERFTFDLTECTTMDSTFLGVLAGFAIRLGDHGQNHSGNGAPATLELCNPNTRILDLLENLGVSDYFRQTQNTGTAGCEFRAAPEAGAPASKEELSRTCLEAHRTLMEINPDNIPKFKEVAQFLAEDLKKPKA